ncbi:MAG: hypothetical protein QM768_02925 [Agriterribacter sp.]
MEGRQIAADSNGHTLKYKINGAEITILPSETKTISHDENEERAMTDSQWIIAGYT